MTTGFRAWRLTAVFFAAACGGDGLTETDAPTIAGSWLAQEETTTWTMDLSASGTGAVSGAYLITDSDLGSLALSGPVSGRYDFPAVSLDYSFVLEGISASCAIRGTMAASGQSIAATVTCSGFGESSSDAVDFRRGS